LRRSASGSVSSPLKIVPLFPPVRTFCHWSFLLVFSLAFWSRFSRVLLYWSIRRGGPPQNSARFSIPNKADSTLISFPPPDRLFPWNFSLCRLSIEARGAPPREKETLWVHRSTLTYMCVPLVLELSHHFYSQGISNCTKLPWNVLFPSLTVILVLKRVCLRSGLGRSFLSARSPHPFINEKGMFTNPLFPEHPDFPQPNSSSLRVIP